MILVPVERLHLLNKSVLGVTVAAGGDEGHPVNVHAEVGLGTLLVLSDHELGEELSEGDVVKILCMIPQHFVFIS